ncbi:hypothetical protein AB7813_14710 [Tardiphaga sp. 20_F10_N6_6]|uniref:hypothetical protein n=1 Tax=Tardiphaga sp. 20_F10_N6_6 TaxID=3240788 RepID=UPI003F8C29EC
MPYALFDDDQQRSKQFPTKDDAWKHADEAGLVDVVDGKTVLEDGYTIQPCGLDENGVVVAMPPAVQ